MNVIRVDLCRSPAALEVLHSAPSVIDAVAARQREHASSPDSAFVVIYTIDTWSRPKEPRRIAGVDPDRDRDPELEWRAFAYSLPK
jgi:hypothetical protein